MRLQEYLTEARIPSIDKRILIEVIRSGKVDKNYSIKLTDGTEVKIIKGNKKSPMTFMYPVDRVNITDALVDIIDSDESLNFVPKIKNEVQSFEVRYV